MQKTALIFAACVLATPALAQTNAVPPLKVPDERAAGGHEKVNFLDFYDTNGDAIVSKAEFEAARQRDYRRTATGAPATGISETEYVAEFAERLDRQLRAEREGQIKQAHARFNVLDKNKDGRITEEEFMNSGNNTFNHFDSNKDGVVDEKDKSEAF